jgi:hypothetical protein
LGSLAIQGTNSQRFFVRRKDLATDRLAGTRSRYRRPEQLPGIGIGQKTPRGFFHGTSNPTSCLRLEFSGLEASLARGCEYDSSCRTGKHLPFDLHVGGAFLPGVCTNATDSQVDLFNLRCHDKLTLAVRANIEELLWIPGQFDAGLRKRVSNRADQGAFRECGCSTIPFERRTRNAKYPVPELAKNFASLERDYDFCELN